MSDEQLEEYEGYDEEDSQGSQNQSKKKKGYHQTDGDVLQALGLLNKDGDSCVPREWDLCKIGALTVAFIVFSNMICLGLEVDLGNIRRPGQTWTNIDFLFTGLFVIEMTIRIVVGRGRFFIGRMPLPPKAKGEVVESDGSCRRGCKTKMGGFMQSLKYMNYYNVVDLFLVILRLVDVCLTNMETSQDQATMYMDISCGGVDPVPCGVCMCKSPQRLFLKLFSAFRIIRVGFAVKHVRLIKGFRELWLIMAGMADTCKTLIWVLGLLLLLMWVLAILFTVAIGHNDSLIAQVDYSDSDWELKEYWGTVVKSLFTLFQVITLDSWSQSVVWPLVRKYPVFIIPFVFFLCIAVICLLNLIAGVVVESTLTSARANEEREDKEQQRTYAKVMDSLEQMFHEADDDGNGWLDRVELANMLKLTRVRDRLRMLEIPLRELDKLYCLLERDGEGVKIDKFFRGCSRLRGPAMACDLYHMDVDLQRHIKQTNSFTGDMQKNNQILGKLLDLVDCVDREIIRGEDDDKDPVLKARRARGRNPRSFIKGGGLDHEKAIRLPSKNTRQSSKFEMTVMEQKRGLDMEYKK